MIQECAESNAAPRVRSLTEALSRAHYTTIVTSEVAFPTLLALRTGTGLPDVMPTHGSLLLDESRGAAFAWTQCNGRDVLIYATHLDHMCGRARLVEVVSLLRHARAATQGDTCSDMPPCVTEDGGSADEPVVLVVGDLNQQREIDMSPAEWGLVLESKTSRGREPGTDGVDAMLQEAGFRCCFDYPDADRNWSPELGPPPTHWSSTAIDFAYARGNRVEGSGVYIYPSTLSDHHPVISDWRM